MYVYHRCNKTRLIGRSFFFEENYELLSAALCNTSASNKVY